jgi:NAD(P)-dependent dehydrogenase (short-subunit alcohol dehydrogenase family)
LKTVLLTGAGGGIGHALLSALAADDAYRVIAVTRPAPSAGSETTPETTENSGRLIRKTADLSSFAEISNLEASIARGNIDLDWLVFAHGFIDSETVLEKQRPEDIATTFQVNVLSVIHLCQLFLKHMSKGGGILCLSSTAGLEANGRYAAYSASKAAVNNFMEALARNRPALTFFTVCAGPTRTAMLEKIGGDLAGGQDVSAVKDLMLRIMTRPGDYKSGDIIVVRDGRVTLGGRL